MAKKKQDEPLAPDPVFELPGTVEGTSTDPGVLTGDDAGDETDQATEDAEGSQSNDTIDPATIEDDKELEPSSYEGEIPMYAPNGTKQVAVPYGEADYDGVRPVRIYRPRGFRGQTLAHGDDVGALLLQGFRHASDVGADR